MLVMNFLPPEKKNRPSTLSVPNFSTGETFSVGKFRREQQTTAGLVFLPPQNGGQIGL